MGSRPARSTASHAVPTVAALTAAGKMALPAEEEEEPATALRPGQTVLVRFGPGPKGLMASEVRPDGGPHMLASH